MRATTRLTGLSAALACVVGGRALLHAGHHRVPLGLGDVNRTRRGVARHVAERVVPQHVIPVRVGREARPWPQAAGRQVRRQRGEVGHRDGGVDDQAAAIRGGDDRARGQVDLTGGNQHPRRDLCQPAGHPASSRCRARRVRDHDFGVVLTATLQGADPARPRGAA
jgi:hypothetical protein